MTDKECRWLITAIVLFSISLLLLTCLRWKHELEHHDDDEPIVRHDTTYVSIIDTIHDTLPPIIKTRYLRDTIYLAKDTSGVEHHISLPITQNFYKKDGLYEAWVSGFRPSLDSINVTREKEVMTIVETKKEIQREWKLYAQGGFFAREGIFLPSVGVSLSTPKKWSLGANISVPYKGSPIYNFSVGYNLLPNKH
jgi:hypothetical protein